MKPPAIFMVSKNKQSLKFFKSRFKAELYINYLQELEQNPDTQYEIDKILLYDYAVSDNAHVKTYFVSHYISAGAYTITIDTKEKLLSNRVRFADTKNKTGSVVSGYSINSADDARNIVKEYLKTERG